MAFYRTFFIKSQSGRIFVVRYAEPSGIKVEISSANTFRSYSEGSAPELQKNAVKLSQEESVKFLASSFFRNTNEDPPRNSSLPEAFF